MTVISLPSRRSGRIRPYLLALERRRAADSRAFVQFVGLALLNGLGMGR